MIGRYYDVCMYVYIQYVGVTARACAGRLQEISNYLEYFLGPDSNVPLTEGDLINILNQMVPAQWRRSMININFQPFNKSMTEGIEYMEKLEVLEATNKQSSTKKGDKDKSEDKRNILSPRARRERDMTLTLRMTGMTSTVLSVKPKEGHLLESCIFIYESYGYA